MAQQFDDLFATAGAATIATTHGFTEGSGDDVHSVLHAKLLGSTTPAFADVTGGMTVVYHHQSVVFIRQIADLVQLCHISIHGEHAVCADQAILHVLSILQMLFQLLHIGVFVAISFGFAQANAIDDGGMIQLV